MNQNDEETEKALAFHRKIDDLKQRHHEHMEDLRNKMREAEHAHYLALHEAWQAYEASKGGENDESKR